MYTNRNPNWQRPQIEDAQRFRAQQYQRAWALQQLLPTQHLGGAYIPALQANPTFAVANILSQSQKPINDTFRKIIQRPDLIVSVPSVGVAYRLHRAIVIPQSGHFRRILSGASLRKQEIQFGIPWLTHDIFQIIVDHFYGAHYVIPKKFDLNEVLTVFKAAAEFDIRRLMKEMIYSFTILSALWKENADRLKKQKKDERYFNLWNAFIQVSKMVPRTSEFWELMKNWGSLIIPSFISLGEKTRLLNSQDLMMKGFDRMAGSLIVDCLIGIIGPDRLCKVCGLGYVEGFGKECGVCGAFTY